MRVYNLLTPVPCLFATNILSQRAELLKSLLQVKGTPELLSKLTSIAEVQTKGVKRLYEDYDELPSTVKLSDVKKTRLNSIKGKRKQKTEKQTKVYDPNVVGFSVSMLFIRIFFSNIIRFTKFYKLMSFSLRILKMRAMANSLKS